MKRWFLIALIGVAVAGALAAGAWQVAYARGRDDGRTEVTALRNEFVQARGGGAAGRAGAGPGGAAGGNRQGVNGTIEKVDGNVVTVATADGSVSVTLSDTTRIGKEVAATPADLKAGDRILVVGERTSDTDVTATTIQIQPPSQEQGQGQGRGQDRGQGQPGQGQGQAPGQGQ